MSSFDEIENMLSKLRDREYKIFNIKIISEESNKLKKEIDINKKSHDVSQIEKKVNDYKKRRKKKKKQEESYYNIGNELSNMKFIHSEINRKEWSELDKIEKKKALVEFLDTLKLNEELYNIILKKRLLKNDVYYNIFNQKIEGLSFLEIKDNEYIIKEKKKKTTKKLKIFK